MLKVVGFLPMASYSSMTRRHSRCIRPSPLDIRCSRRKCSSSVPMFSLGNTYRRSPPRDHSSAAPNAVAARRNPTIYSPIFLRGSSGQTDTPIGVCPCPSGKGQVDKTGHCPLLSAVRDDCLISHRRAPARPARPRSRSASTSASRLLLGGKPDPGHPSFRLKTALRARRRYATRPE